MTGAGADRLAVIHLPLIGTTARVVVTTRAFGDVRPSAAGALARQAAAGLGGPWRATKQVHGAGVAVVTASDEPPRGMLEVDALVGRAGDVPAMAMFAADCALVGIGSPEGVIGVAHAGWPGLLAGVIEAVADAMRSLGASALTAWRGPCISPECYEFGEEDLSRVARRYGDTVRSTTASGRPALDLAAGVRAAASSAGIVLAGEIASCTACATSADGSPLWFSHRARRDDARHALVVTGP